jgi:hypothetical protein
MVAYKMVQTPESFFNIIETSKDNEIILTVDNKSDAQSLCRQMNLGNIGFDGWTPTFMTRSVSDYIGSDIDDDDDDDEVME